MSNTKPLRVLVTGSKGQLGCEIKRCLKNMSGEIGAIPARYSGAIGRFVDADVLDITDSDAVFDDVRAFKPDIIINCAAYTNVDGCENNEELAFAVNCSGAENLARASEKFGAKLVHVSTDYVFSGDTPGQRTESDPTGPVSAYGRTKFAGENAVLRACSRAFVVRTAWLYGYVGKNFVKTMRALGETHSSITVVDDQLGNPTSANDLAYEILKLALTEEYGIYHCTNNGTVSWAGFAKAIMEGFSLPCEVVGVTSEEYKAANPMSASRPAFSSLDNAHLRQTIGDEMRPWEEALESFLSNIGQLEDEPV